MSGRLFYGYNFPHTHSFQKEDACIFPMDGRISCVSRARVKLLKIT